MRASIVILSTLLFGASAVAETDVFLRAVGFALTGSDDTQVRAIDRKNCVFGIGRQVFYLNNVHVDRVYVQGWKAAVTGDPYVTVDIHGDSTVYENTLDPVMNDDDRGNSNVREFNRIMRNTRPDLFKPSHVSTNEQTLTLSTSEMDRVVRAWKYVYANGCAGKASPF